MPVRNKAGPKSHYPETIQGIVIPVDQVDMVIGIRQDLDQGAACDHRLVQDRPHGIYRTYPAIRAITQPDVAVFLDCTGPQTAGIPRHVLVPIFVQHHTYIETLGVRDVSIYSHTLEEQGG